MSWSLSVTDLGNGSGASIDFGAGSGADFRLQRQTVSVASYGDWEDVFGPVSGSGHTTVAGLGHFRWQLVADSGGATLAGPVQRTITQSGDSPWLRCVDMIADRIRSIGITAIAAEDVITGQVIDLDEYPLEDDQPVVVVSAAGFEELKLGGPINADDIGYQVGIEMLETMKAVTLVDGGLNTRSPRWYSIRHRIERAIDMQRWDLRVPELNIVRANTGPAVEMNTVVRDRIRRGLIVAVCECREFRGTDI